MGVAENKQLIRKGFEEGINRQDLELFRTLLAEDYVNHSMPAPAPGAEGFIQVLQSFFAGFPDMHITLHDVIGAGDRVATRGVMSGTHRGDFMGIPATGKPVSIQYADVWRLENGKGVENWVVLDMLGMMQQLGVIPAPDQSS